MHLPPLTSQSLISLVSNNKRPVRRPLPSESFDLNLRHLRTIVTPEWERPSGTLIHGLTLWGAIEDQPIGISWEWALIANVPFLVVANLMTVTTNLRLVSPNGDQLSTSDLIPYVNRIIRNTSWQDEVALAAGITITDIN